MHSTPLCAHRRSCACVQAQPNPEKHAHTRRERTHSRQGVHTYYTSVACTHIHTATYCTRFYVPSTTRLAGHERSHTHQPTCLQPPTVFEFAMPHDTTPLETDTYTHRQHTQTLNTGPTHSVALLSTRHELRSCESPHSDGQPPHPQQSAAETETLQLNSETNQGDNQATVKVRFLVREESSLDTLQQKWEHQQALHPAAGTLPRGERARCMCARDNECRTQKEKTPPQIKPRDMCATFTSANGSRCLVLSRIERRQHKIVVRTTTEVGILTRRQTQVLAETTHA